MLSHLKHTKAFLTQHKKLLFPSFILLVFVLLVAFKISGTSIGVYHDFLYGNSAKDPSLLYGKPQPIRSDEWLVVTQKTISQEQNEFNKVSGHEDMSILLDVPYKEWSAAFKPQNLSFFALPFEYAFAFKWWFLLAALLLSSYYFFLRLFPNQVAVAALASVIISFSPFVFWWYQSATILPLAYGFLVMAIGMSIINRSRLKVGGHTIKPFYALSLKTISMAYILCCFAFILYPPFQIPVAIVGFFFLLGYALNQKKGLLKKHWKHIFLPFVAASLLTAAVVSAFFVSRSEAISTITNTAYPGKRVVSSGGYEVKKLLVNYLQPQLQREGREKSYFNNQSESSSFIVLPLFLILPALFLVYKYYKRHKKVEWVLTALVVCTLLFLAQLFVPGLALLSKFSLLYLVPQERLVLGLGFIAIIMLVYGIKIASKEYFERKDKVALLFYTGVYFGLTVWAGFETAKTYPQFISSKKLVVLLAAIVIIGVGLVLTKRFRIGLGILALFSVASVIFIHPLYVGLGPIYNNEVKSSIQQLSGKGDTWAAAQSIYIENFPQISGRAAVTGVSSYPNNAFWEKYSDAGDSSIYNRYAHILLSSNDISSLILLGPDIFAVSAGCQRKVSEKIDYVISVTPLEDSCEQLIKTIVYPNVTFYFYKQ